MIAAGIIAGRSTRETGHSGLCQSRGHRTPESLIQSITGSTRGEAARSVRVGMSLLDSGQASDGGGPDNAAAATRNLLDGGADHPGQAVPWDEPLRIALRDGAISASQYDVIRRGLGEPPSSDTHEGADAATSDAWTRAAEQLVSETGERTVEELGASARMIRDLLDPESAERRFLARFERRSFRTYRDHEGMRRASITFDDEGGAFIDALIDAAMRPRRGGPRFVDADEKARAAELTDDPRTNDQLTYDLVLDVLRARALADVSSVFGTRQAGVRLVRVVDTDGRGAPLAHTEDGLTAVPSASAEQQLCNSGFTSVTVDGSGNPLDVGREQRLFTPKQRIALAIRDGGCRWRGCDRPASYCEAHHIDPFADGGRTDIDRGILLCRFHHMNVHHGRWRITRAGPGDFVLHHPGGETFVLRPRAALGYAWAGIDPPPRRFRPAA